MQKLKIFQEFGQASLSSKIKIGQWTKQTIQAATNFLSKMKVCLFVVIKSFHNKVIAKFVYKEQSFEQFFVKI